MNERILIIDDETNIRTMIRLTLEHAGYQVGAAVDGQEGLKMFGDGSNWDLVLVDQRMPGLTGLEVQQEIHRRTPDKRIIMITAFGTIELALDCIQGGAMDFLRKPFTADTLKQAVGTALERKPEMMHAAPLNLVCREFTRTTINGFSFDVYDELPEADTLKNDEGRQSRFIVRAGATGATPITVVLPAYLLELALAHIDSEEVPGGESFWHALAEEALANYLWHHAEVPAGGVLRVEDLNPGLEHWLDAMMTVDVKKQNVAQ